MLSIMSCFCHNSTEYKLFCHIFWFQIVLEDSVDTIKNKGKTKEQLVKEEKEKAEEEAYRVSIFESYNCLKL